MCLTSCVKHIFAKAFTIVRLGFYNYSHPPFTSFVICRLKKFAARGNLTRSPLCGFVSSPNWILNMSPVSLLAAECKGGEGKNIKLSTSLSITIFVWHFCQNCPLAVNTKLWADFNVTVQQREITTDTNTAKQNWLGIAVVVGRLQFQGAIHLH